MNYSQRTKRAKTDASHISTIERTIGSNEDNQFRVQPSSLFNLTPELVGGIATYLDIFSEDLSNFVVVLGCATLLDGKKNSFCTSDSETYLDAVRIATLKRESYLDELFSYMPKNTIPATSSIEQELNIKQAAIGERVRIWMNANEDWDDRVVEAMLCDSWSVESSGLLRRVTVSGEVAASLILEDKFQPDYRYFLSKETKHAGLLGEIGNLLVSVDGQYCQYMEKKHMFASKEKEDNVDLCFIQRSDLIFNHPSVAIRLGLVEILRAMVNKGLIHATTNHFSGTYPLLWGTYSTSPNASCLEYMLSLPDVNCSQIGHRGHRFLHHIMFYMIDANKLPLGKDAILAIANHPTTDINALDDGGETALHLCVKRCKYRDYCDGDILLTKIEALLDGRADPRITNRENITAMQLFRSCRSEPRSMRWWCKGRDVGRGEIHESHLDQIEVALQTAIANA